MDFNEFKASVNNEFPPEKIDKNLKALWWDAKGKWEKAHRMVQNINNTTASRVHAYLHRKEGDLSNASFWYTNAGQRMRANSPDEEWDEIVNTILDKENRFEHH